MNADARALPLADASIETIILAADNAYAMPLATTLRSIVESNRASWPIHFRILDTDMSPARKQKVAELLRELGYSLQGNRKTREGSQHPDRNAHAHDLRRPHHAQRAVTRPPEVQGWFRAWTM